MLLPPWGQNSESLHSPRSITPGHVPSARNHYLQSRQNLIKGCCATSLLGYWNNSIAQNNCTTPFANCLIFLFLLFSVTGWHVSASAAALTCPCSTELSDVHPWHLIHIFSLPFAKWVLSGSPEAWILDDRAVWQPAPWVVWLVCRQLPPLGCQPSPQAALHSNYCHQPGHVWQVFFPKTYISSLGFMGFCGISLHLFKGFSMG